MFDLNGIITFVVTSFFLTVRRQSFGFSVLVLKDFKQPYLRLNSICFITVLNKLL